MTVDVGIDTSTRGRRVHTIWFVQNEWFQDLNVARDLLPRTNLACSCKDIVGDKLVPSHQLGTRARTALLAAHGRPSYEC